jgi:hypothetical protein
MNVQHDGIEFGDTRPTSHRAYSAPRLQRLGRVSELTEINASQTWDGNGYAS